MTVECHRRLIESIHLEDNAYNLDCAPIIEPVHFDIFARTITVEVRKCNVCCSRHYQLIYIQCERDLCISNYT